jgi:DUF1009 family protein
VERALGLMCGAGVLPARMAAEARRQGWRVIAFAFGDAVGLPPHVERVVPSRITALGDVIATIARERLGATLFSGTFGMVNVLNQARPDGVSDGILRQAGSLRHADLTAAIVTTLGALGVDVEIVTKDPVVKGFSVVKRRWVVERTLGWIMLHRRLARDYEALPDNSASMIRIAMIDNLLKRITDETTPTWRDT